MISTLFVNATILDGTGRAPYATDVALVGDRIALIGDLHEREAYERVDCTGRVLAPGFIDVHSHSDELWLALPRCDGKIAQGVTTEIAGNCGMSAAPLAGPGYERVRERGRAAGLEVRWRSLDEFLGLVERNGVALNVATLVGLGNTRQVVAGDDERRLDAAELAAQAHAVREACEQGALGVSSGLIYPPSRYADTDELVAMAGAAREAGAARYVTHLRSESDALLEAVGEALEIGRRADTLVQISHHKAMDEKHWGAVHHTLEQIDRARLHGLDVQCDVYPYVASWTQLATILPPQTRFGGLEATLERLGDPQQSALIALQLQMTREPRGWHDVLITDAGMGRNASLAGLRMDEIARRWGLSPERAALRLLREEHLDVGAVFFRMCEDDVAAVLSAEFCCVGSDAPVCALAGPTARGVVHPRTFGSFPRVLRRFVRERKTLELAEAVRRMTALPASLFGLRGRGSIAVGNFADLTLFDARTVSDTATYERPYSLPVGIERVYVNGRPVWREGGFTRELPGRVLRG